MRLSGIGEDEAGARVVVQDERRGVGPYQDTVEDQTKFSRPDRAEAKVLEWIKRSTQVPLYLTGDSGCGKSSLLNAFALPKLRELGWTVVEARRRRIRKAGSATSY